MDFDAKLFNKATEAFRSLGSALSDLQVYTAEHPHFQESLKTAHGHITKYFDSGPEGRHLNFTVRGDRAEFLKVPLVNTGLQGARLIKVMKAAGVAGLQIRRGITTSECQALIRSLIRRAKAGKPTRLDAKSEDSGEQDKERSFRVFSPEEARRIQLELAGYSETTSSEAERVIPMPEINVSSVSFQSLLTSHHVLISNLEAGNAVDLDLIRGAADQAIALTRSPDAFAVSNLSRGYFDDFTFHHSINVCLLATQLISMATEDEDQIRRVSLAALLHDVGKTRIPKEILHKPGRLTDAEFNEIQKHPLLGADILMGVEAIDPLCISVAFGHHLHAGGRSYPFTKTPYQGDWVTRLISVVDIYEALTAVRPYKKGLSPSTAFEVMLSMPGLQDKKPYVKMLYDCIGPYPLGTYVELNTGERAMVVEQNPRFPRRPRLCVLTDREGGRLSQSISLDLADSETFLTESQIPSIRRAVVLQAPGDDPLDVELEPEPEKILGTSILSDENLMEREA